jgi:hypothetical protein
MDATTVVTALTLASHHPLAKKSLGKVVDLLICPVDYLKAVAAAKVARVEAEGKAEAMRIVAEAKGYEKQLSKDPEMRARAAARHEATVLRLQANREAVVAGYLEGLGVGEPPAPTEEIGSDWLNAFADVVEKIDRPEVQRLFSRILDGEVRKPGSFAPQTLVTLASLTRDTAQIFQRLANCAVSFPTYPEWIPCIPHTLLGEMPALGFSVHELDDVADFGLINVEKQVSRRVTREMMLSGVKIGSQVFRFQDAKVDRPVDDEPCHILRFTRAGLELLSIVNTEPSALVLEKLVAWTTPRMQITRVL